MRKIVADAPPFIKKMSLETLSREASFLYAVDFRTGCERPLVGIEALEGRQ